MRDLAALYQSIILEHNRKPRNFREMEGADRTVEGRNPLCGDQLTVWLRLDGDVISDVSFVASGCAISKASASLMTAAVKGKTRAEAEALFRRVHDMVTGRQEGTPDDQSLGSLAALSGVARFPIRVKCASLPWHALRSALAEGNGVVSTEAAGDG
ncbi:MAG TPA: SUF system NifU family Fe-S cluster assembly protein [Gemmatimonadaceae bacterium]|nr:SUF system NifU family Fe-S cluster assembly protein [Gemmatimonadaceae bacterium]